MPPKTLEPSGLVGQVVLPVARVAVDSPLPHLDRPFDYLVTPELDAQVQVGSRVRVRFAGRLLDGWVLSRHAASEHDGSLTTIERAVGGEPVLSPATAALFRAVADRWAGTFADVVRLGVPPRHARAESPPRQTRAESPPGHASAVQPNAEPERVRPPDPAGWSNYRSGPAFLAAVQDGRPARAVWNSLPGEDWPTRVAEAVQSCLAGGRGAIVAVPDRRDLAHVDSALAAALPAAAHVTLSAQLGPEARYRRWLAVKRGAVVAVAGNRSAVFAPVRDLGLIVVIDDGDDLLAEQRAPYPHARDVAVLRASMADAALLIGGPARTAEAQQLVESGWAHEIVADRPTIRARSPRIVVAGDDFEVARDPAARSARLPALAFRAARAALDADRPVLVQVPRGGHTPALRCAADGTPVRCAHCHGPVEIWHQGQVRSCRWCGRTSVGWRCPRCKGEKVRAAVIGAARTAEEIGRAFPSTVVRSSGGGAGHGSGAVNGAAAVLADIAPGACIVIATPGAEPTVAGGYGAALLLDGWAMLSRPDLRAGEETLRRWLNAAALCAPEATVVVGADPSLAAVQALVRWDPAGFAARELADRRELNFPPVCRLAALTGQPADVTRLLAALRLPDSAEELGWVAVEAADGKPARSDAAPEQVRTLIRVARGDGARLAEALHAAAATGSARKVGGPVRIVLDPQELW